MSHILTLMGSPTASTKVTAVMEFTQCVIRRSAACSHMVSVRNLPAEALIHGNPTDPHVQDAVAWVEQADGIIITTPICKFSFSGVLKTFLDLLPARALQGKIILPIATCSSPTSAVTLGYTLNPVLASLGATQILTAVAVSERQVQFEHGGGLSLDSTIEESLRGSIYDLLQATRRLNNAYLAPEYSI